MENSIHNMKHSSTFTDWFINDKLTTTRSVNIPKTEMVDNLFNILDKFGYENTLKVMYTYRNSINNKNDVQFSSFEGGNNMENNNLLEKYIEKVDRDQSDLRIDIRASEERTAKSISEIQQRMDDRLNRIEDLLVKQNDNFEIKFDKLENKIDNKFDNLERKVDDNKRFMRNIEITIIVALVATTLGASALGLSLVQIVQNLVSLVK